MRLISNFSFIYNTKWKNSEKLEQKKNYKMETKMQMILNPSDKKSFSFKVEDEDGIKFSWKEWDYNDSGIDSGIFTEYYFSKKEKIVMSSEVNMKTFASSKPKLEKNFFSSERGKKLFSPEEVKKLLK